MGKITGLAWLLIITASMYLPADTGGGITRYSWKRDRNPPVITIEYDEIQYFSPNNDGKSDFLEFPISITDERYVISWEWAIKDEKGSVVRTYGNGAKNPSARRPGIRKINAEVPPSLRWDGISDSGKLAPDGRYFFTITAVDDSGNTASTKTYEAVLKNSAPQISIEPIEDSQKIFNPLGSRNTISFNPKGVSEEKWESKIINSRGEIVRTFENQSGTTLPLAWDGYTDTGEIAEEGVYTFNIAATDKAQNSAQASMANIILYTIMPQPRIVIADPWFSPNEDGIKDTLLMRLVIPSKDEVTKLNIKIKDSKDNIVSNIVSNINSSSVREQFIFNGKNNRGEILEEGKYTAELSVSYKNGLISTAVSPEFNLKVTPPQAKVSSDFASFNYSGSQNEMIIKQEASDETEWIGEIRREDTPADENPVRRFRFTGVPPAEIRWNGRSEGGTIAADGRYTYELSATDKAGNTGRSNRLSFTLNTKGALVTISSDLRSFSPNADRVKDTINLLPVAKERDGIASYKVDILGSNGRPVKSFEGTLLIPDRIIWDGRTDENTPAPEGIYRARIELLYENGNRLNYTSPAFELDNTAPKGTVSAPFTVFSPHGERGTIPFSITTEADDEWEAFIAANDGKPVKTWNWKGRAPQIAWDGRDSAGNAAADGVYQFIVQSTDEAGNSARYLIPAIVLDTRQPKLFITSTASAELVSFNIFCSLREGIEDWKLEIKDEKGTLIKNFASEPSKPAGAIGRTTPPPAVINWNRLSDNGKIIEGNLSAVLNVNYTKGDRLNAETALDTF